MSSKINAISTGVGGLATSADASGILELQTNDTTAVTVDASQVVSFDNNFGTVAGLPSYQCRAWVNFNGTGTVAIRASGNVSSITDRNTGRYTVNLTTAMPDTNYNISCGGSSNNGDNVGEAIQAYASSTTAIPVTTGSGAAYIDFPTVCIAIFR